MLVHTAVPRATHKYTSRGLDAWQNIPLPLPPLQFIDQHHEHFSFLELGAGEGHLLLDVQKLAPRANVLGLNKPLPSYPDMDRTIARDEAKLRESAQTFNILLPSHSNFPKVVLTNDSIKYMREHLASKRTQMVLSTQSLHYLSANEKIALARQTVRILNADAGLAYFHYPAQSTCEMHLADAIELKGNEAALIRCDPSCGGGRERHTAGQPPTNSGCLACFYMVGSERLSERFQKLPYQLRSKQTADCKRHSILCKRGTANYVLSVVKGPNKTMEGVRKFFDGMPALGSRLRGNWNVAPLLECLIMDSPTNFHGALRSFSYRHRTEAHLQDIFNQQSLPPPPPPPPPLAL